MTILILIIKAFLLGWFLSSFEPLQEILALYKKDIKDDKYYVFYLKTAVSCWKCLSFWSGVLLGGFWVGAAAGLLAMIADKRVNK